MVGMNQRKIGAKNDAVFSDEKVSVDSVKITPAHTIAGHHARSQLHARGCRKRD
jgi:hypothetical protein